MRESHGNNQWNPQNNVRFFHSIFTRCKSPILPLFYPDYFPSQRNFVSQSGKKFFPVREKILPNWGQKRGLPEPSSNYCQSIKSIQIELFENDGSIIVFVTPYYLYKGLLLLYIKTSLLIVSRLCLCLMAKLP